MQFLRIQQMSLCVSQLEKETEKKFVHIQIGTLPKAALLLIETKKKN